MAQETFSTFSFGVSFSKTYMLCFHPKYLSPVKMSKLFFFDTSNKTSFLLYCFELSFSENFVSFFAYKFNIMFWVDFCNWNMLEAFKVFKYGSSFLVSLQTYFILYCGRNNYLESKTGSSKNSEKKTFYCYPRQILSINIWISVWPEFYNFFLQKPSF